MQLFRKAFSGSLTSSKETYLHGVEFERKRRQYFEMQQVLEKLLSDVRDPEMAKKSLSEKGTIQARIEHLAAVKEIQREKPEEGEAVN